MAEEEKPGGSEATAVPITYKKSNFFRVIHADGAYGGAAPRGNLNFAFYSERTPLPRVTEMMVVDGMPRAEKVLDTTPGLFRELEVGVIMDVSTALGFQAWLNGRMELLRTLNGISEEDWAKMKAAVSP